MQTDELPHCFRIRARRQLQYYVRWHHKSWIYSASFSSSACQAVRRFSRWRVTEIIFGCHLVRLRLKREKTSHHWIDDWTVSIDYCYVSNWVQAEIWLFFFRLSNLLYSMKLVNEMKWVHSKRMSFSHKNYLPVQFHVHFNRKHDSNATRYYESH